MIRTASPNVLLVQPRFNPNAFWNYHETCAVAGARYSAAPLGLVTVAGLLPPDWSPRLVDRNIEELRDDDLDWADLVMVGCMMPQQQDAKRVIALAHARGKPVVIGGPDVTSSPDVYAEAEFRVLGEAEAIMADFVAAWRDGATRGHLHRHGVSRPGDLSVAALRPAEAATTTCTSGCSSPAVAPISASSATSSS